MKFWKVKLSAWYSTGPAFSNFTIGAVAKTAEKAEEIVKKKHAIYHRIEIISVKEFKPRKARTFYI